MVFQTPVYGRFWIDVFGSAHIVKVSLWQSSLVKICDALVMVHSCPTPYTDIYVRFSFNLSTG